MRLASISALSALSVIGLFSACSKDKPEPLVPAAGTVEAVERATNDIANARCDREQRCNRIGPEGEYADRNHCMNVMTQKAREDMNQCHGGVDQEDLRQCLTEIANKDCSGIFADIGEYKACGMDDLCAD